jgi:DNA-binding CsgD family transcriptional regulator
VEASLRLRSPDPSAAVDYANRTITLASALREPEFVMTGYRLLGSARLYQGDERGWSDLERSFAMGIEIGAEPCTTRALGVLAAAAATNRRHPQVERYLEWGLARAVESDLDADRLSMLCWQALARLNQGRWHEAALAVTGARDHPLALDTAKILSRLVLGRIRARRGDPDAATALNEAVTLAEECDQLQLLAQAHAARIEAAWWAGTEEPGLEQAKQARHRIPESWLHWERGELDFWLWKAGAVGKLPTSRAVPYELQSRGEWREAADEWKRIGCPFEEALALAECPDEQSLRRALSLMTMLGSPPGVAMVTRRLRRMGARGIPKGPRAITRLNPASLTNRELDVIRLLGGGLRNAEIAHRLRLSPKTVGHHVSSILGKLDVRSRTEAVREAAALGLIESAQRQGGTGS